ncbi:hypothetical protein FACS189428_5350 [Clostridia bacterium]|nr:hypothetical protein FACS189428_5350 [Clostridia bacterium]
MIELFVNDLLVNCECGRNKLYVENKQKEWSIVREALKTKTVTYITSRWVIDGCPNFLKGQHIHFQYFILPFQGVWDGVMIFCTQGVAVGLGYVGLSAHGKNTQIVLKKKHFEKLQKIINQMLSGLKKSTYFCSRL